MTVAEVTYLANDQVVTDIAVESDFDVLCGVMAEYDNIDDVFDTAEKVRDAGYTRWDVHSPFPIHGIEKSMSIRPTILPWICLGGGLAGLLGREAVRRSLLVGSLASLAGNLPLLVSIHRREATIASV